MVALFAITSASAQGFGWGIKAGLNLASIHGGDAGDVKIKPDLVAGVFADYRFSDLMGGTVELLYSGQGTSANIDMRKQTVNYSYVNLPIMANFFVAEGLSLNIGIQPGLYVAKSGKMGDNTIPQEFIETPNSFDFLSLWARATD